jgi:hypothetical protein
MRRWKELCPHFVMVCVLLLVLLANGCSSKSTADSNLHTTVSVNQTARQATIELSIAGGESLVAVFVTNPTGDRQLKLRSSIDEDGGASVNIGNLGSGDYVYEVYWIPRGDGRPEAVSVEQIVQGGAKLTGAFTVQ